MRSLNNQVLHKVVRQYISTREKKRLSMYSKENTKRPLVIVLSKWDTGAFAVIPRRVPHGFKNIGNDQARFLVTITPGGFEKFFEEVDSLDLEKIPSIAKKYGLELL